MTASLKTANRKYLAAYTLAHLLVLTWILSGMSSPTLQDLPSILSTDLFKASIVLAPTIVAMIANGIIDRRTKTRLVYLRWTNPEPACRAFSEISTRDTRVDQDSLRRQFETNYPTSAEQQQTAWIKLLRKHESDPAVRTNHGEWLLFRDIASLSWIATLGSAGASIEQSFSTPSLIYLAASVALTVTFMIVARNYGDQFVGTVLSCASSSDTPQDQYRDDNGGK